MKRSAGATNADSGDAGRVRARAADAAPRRPRARFKDWEDYWKNGTRFTDDFYEAMEELDRDLLPLEEREPFD